MTSKYESCQLANEVTNICFSRYFPERFERLERRVAVERLERASIF
jgi:hypothetical protein